MPYIYYKKEFEIDNNKKIGLIFADSCTLLCSNFSYANNGGGYWAGFPMDQSDCSEEQK